MNTVNDPDTKPVVFRLARTGRTVSAAYSHDGKAWTEFQPVELPMPGEVRVGVYVAHNFDKPLDVVFEPLTVERKNEGVTR